MKPKGTKLKWFQECKKDLRHIGITENQINDGGVFGGLVKNYKGFNVRSEYRKQKGVCQKRERRHWMDSSRDTSMMSMSEDKQEIEIRLVVNTQSLEEVIIKFFRFKKNIN